MLIAIDNFLEMNNDMEVSEKWTKIYEEIKRNTRKHLWDTENQKFKPHVYVRGEEFPSVVEDQIYNHGGTIVAMEAGLLSRQEIITSLRKMRENVSAAGAQSIGLTIYPSYPEGSFENKGMGAYQYQNGGDWTWFGARIIPQLVRHDLTEDAITELKPFVDRVLENDGFFEWYTIDGQPKGSGVFKGSAGVLLEAIEAINSIGNQEPTTGIPGFRTQLIDSLLSSAVQNGEIPGAVAYINRGGNEVYHKAFGYRKLEGEVPMQTDDIFRMASMTTALTAVSILQLSERGLLFIDDKVSQYIPAFKNPQILVEIHEDSSFTAVPSEREITIRQLLTHTSGIGYGFMDESYNSLVIKHNVSEGFEDDDRSSMENTLRLAELPLLFTPGEKYTYGMSYDVLGVVIEVVTGLRFDKYVQQYILDPLEMNDSYFVVPTEERHRLVSIYQPSEGGLIPTSYPDTAYPVLDHRRFFSGGGDLCSTAEDYGKFVQMILNQGVFENTRILGVRYVEMMLMKQTNLDEGNSVQGFAAWVINKRGAAKGPMAEGSFSFGGFWDTQSWADPEGDFVAVLLLQMYPGNKHWIHWKFKNITYGVIDDFD